ncbi:MAG: imidazole glycerol phosphate synthase subunit HisH [Armatimonadota bacterium]
MRIAIVDYGMGNLRSVQKAMQYLGFTADITSDPKEVARADKVILPGVGAFGAAMRNLSALRSDDGTAMAGVLLQCIDDGRPVLGICLGMQLLLSVSEEMGQHRGFGVIPGRVVRFAQTPGLKVPHMGWNSLRILRRAPVLVDVPDGAMVYFVHSYYCMPEDSEVWATSTEHGVEFCSSLWRDNLFATQFHPEKSGEVGLCMLRNFARL